MPLVHRFIAFQIKTLVDPERNTGVAGFVRDGRGDRSF
jgi:hypothetical protein